MRIKKSTLKLLLITIAAVASIIFLFHRFAGAIVLSSQNNTFIPIFLTGLFVGGLTCMAVQGGLLAATIAQREEERLKDKAKKGSALPILSFLIAKIIAYTLLGLLLGSLGSIFQLSLTFRTLLQFFVVFFMIGTALNILEVHPIFRYFVLQPPRFLTRLIRKQSKSKDIFAPALLGAFTVFIPCGTTQAMMALAIASGKPLVGASIMFSFILGTSPLFFLLGYLTTKLGESMQQQFMRFAAFAIILLALFNLNNTIALTGSKYTLENAWHGAYCAVGYCDTTASGSTMEALDNANIEIASTGYIPSALTVKAGSHVTINLKNTGGQGCIQTFTIPSLGVQQSVPLGSANTVAFTAPKDPGQVPFMCSMGMYRGVINVI